jgi:hypothetical protein
MQDGDRAQENAISLFRHRSFSPLAVARPQKSIILIQSAVPRSKEVGETAMPFKPFWL